MLFYGVFIASLLYSAVQVHSMTFGVIGDFGTGGRKDAAYTEIRTVKSFNDACRQIQCNFTITVGDNFYMANVQQGFQDSFEDMYDRPMKFFASFGNHDNQGVQLQYAKTSKRWHLPSRYYDVVLPIDETGYTVHLFAIDSNGGDWVGWLEENLRKSNSRWKFIYGHHPRTGSGRHSRVGNVNPLHDLMRKYGAQVYFSGHDHILEYNIMDGRAYPISGAMARGGMMLRGRGGSARKFTMSGTGEFNKHPLDWPMHGHLTCELTPNVLAFTYWSESNGVHYETFVTHDWIKKYDQYPKRNYEEPPMEVILQAYKDEKTLPIGPGGGIAFPPSGVATAVKKNPVVPTPSPGPSTPSPPTYSPQPSSAVPTSITKAPPPTQAPARYAVSTECDACVGPTVGHTFTLFLDGATVDASTKIYLSISSDGCDKPNTPGAHVVDGTTITTVTGYTVNFLPTGSGGSYVFVCYSRDGGQTYRRLRRVGTEQKTFKLYSADSVHSTPPPQAGPAPPAPVLQNGGGVETTSAPVLSVTTTATSTSSSSDVLPKAIVVLAVVAMVGVWWRRKEQH